MASLRKRNGTYYVQYYVARKQKRVCLHTKNYQLAKEKLRQLESAMFKGEPLPLPTRTPLPEIVQAYVDYMKVIKTGASFRTDAYFLRQMFGPICPGLQVISRRTSEAAHKCKLVTRCKAPVLEASYLEELTTPRIAMFIIELTKARNLAPKTANRYREIITRLFNWAMAERGIRTPSGINPAAKVGRMRESAPQIRFLTLAQIATQLKALEGYRQLQTMVAVYIYAGLRREELLWLQLHDVDLRAGQHGMIRIRPKEIEGVHWQPKTKSNRAVPISSTLRGYLDRYMPHVNRHSLYFPSPDGERWDVNNFSSHLRKYQEQAGLPWSCLDYRHTFGSQLAMKGESLYKISALMGNSPEICRRHYAALIPEAMTDTVEFPEQKAMRKSREDGQKMA